MKITIESKILQSLADRAKGATESRSSLAVLSGFLLAAKDNSLTLSATNLDMYISLVAECPCEDGAVVINANRLRDAVSAFGPGELVIESDVKHNVTIRRGARILRLFGLPADEMPPVPKFKPEGTLKLSGSAIVRGIGKVLPFVSADETRYVLNGVAISKHEKQSCFVATDGKRLRMETTDQPYVSEAIIPTNAARLLLSLCEANESTVELSLSENAFVATSGNWRLHGKFIEGNFPNWKQAIPDRGDKSVTFPRDAMLSELRAIFSAGADAAGNVVAALSGTAKQLTISTTGKEGSASAEVAGGGTTLASPVGFDAKCLRGFVESFDETEIEATLEEAHCVIMARSATGVAVLMPMRIRIS